LSGPTGPYDHGYLMCRVKYSDCIKMVTWHKYLSEKEFGRLSKGIIAHHKDEDKSNNELDNLEATTRSLHGKHHAKVKEMVDLVCLGCRKKFRRSASQEKHNRGQGKRGPYCGRRCAGLYA